MSFEVATVACKIERNLNAVYITVYMNVIAAPRNQGFDKGPRGGGGFVRNLLRNLESFQISKKCV